jgi:hypothetical protein
MKTKFLLFAFLMISLSLHGQNLTNPFNESALKMRVKQLDEFFARFNYERNIEGEFITAMDTAMRKKYMLSLFDQKFIEKSDAKKRTEILTFINQIVSNNQKLLFDDANWFALTHTQVKYKGKPKTMQILLKPEKDKNAYLRWSIAGIKADFLTLKPKDSTVFLFPISHEMNFMQLSNASTQNKENIAAFAPIGYEPDLLSIFLYMINSGDLAIDFVQKITYQFFQFPDVFFTVENIERTNANVGWLITDFRKMTDAEKQNRLILK